VVASKSVEPSNLVSGVILPVRIPAPKGTQGN
jgi:hypothetical protein